MFFAESNSEHYVKLILTQLSRELTVEEKILDSTLLVQESKGNFQR